MLTYFFLRDILLATSLFLLHDIVNVVLSNPLSLYIFFLWCATCVVIMFLVSLIFFSPHYAARTIAVPIEQRRGIFFHRSLVAVIFFSPFL